MRAGLTPEIVVLAGANLADAVGFEHVTLTALARHFDVKVASLYSHVAGSEGLATGIALLALGEISGRSDASRHPLDRDTALASAGPRIAETLRATIRGYGLGTADETHSVRLLGSVLHGFVSLEASGGFNHSAPDADESWRWTIERLDATLRGLGTERHGS
jgi:AcrR family transcriptional regulator